MIERVPFHRPDVGEEEIAAVTSVLRSGWLTTGAQCKQFEAEFAEFVGAKHAVALNSCTAALHLALEAIGLKQGELVLVPSLTFAATAEVVVYFGATPVLVDCERDTFNIDVAAAERTIDKLQAGRPVGGAVRNGRLRAVLPVHYAGQMADVDGVAALASRHGLSVIEDAAHALPAAAKAKDGKWRSVGTTAEQTCFSFYANKTITTGEGGMLVTQDEALANRARLMSLHGLSRDAWNRFAAGGTWDYKILSAGFKYNLTDVAASIGREQLKKAQGLAEARARIAGRYAELLSDIEEVELPKARSDRRHSWHLYVLRLHLDRLTIDRNAFIEALNAEGIGTSVHWRPLHLHPLYQDRYQYAPDEFPVATAEWKRCVSIPIFPSMSDAQIERVADAIRSIARKHAGSPRKA
jgi:dTDP-4-amino-4,6-dideoxygalactose transaminase